MLSKPISQLKLLQWNAQGATTQEVIAQIDYVLNLEGIHIAFIVETFLSPTHVFKLTNFKIYRKDRLSHGGGVLIAIRDDIEYRCLPDYRTFVAENVSIEVIVNKRPLTFTAAYIPKYTASFAKDIKKITPANKNFIVLGDFNAKHSAWNCLSNNRAGKVLHSMLHNSNFIIHHPDSHTHFPHCGNKPSTIDFVLTNSPMLFSNIYTMDNALPSDHHPVVCTIDVLSMDPKKIASKPNYKKADWTKYSNFVHEQMESFPDTLPMKSDIDKQISKFIEIIKTAEIIAVPKTSTRFQKTTISKETIELIKSRNDTRRQLQRCNDVQLRQTFRSLINAQNRRIKQMVSTDYNNDWNKPLSQLKPGDKKIWSVTKKMMNKSPNQIDILRVDDRYITSALDVSSALADQFHKNHLLTIGYRHAIDKQVEKSVKRINEIRPSSVSSTDHHINTAAIQKIVSKLKIRKAPGIDGITNILLKKLPVRAIEVLANIVNVCTDLCYFPNRFKIARVIPLLKQGKDSKCVASYRPISLLSSVGKIFERIIFVELNDFVTDKTIIKNEQFGFREQHSTVHQIKRIVNMIKENKNRKRSTGMVLIDIEKAFDSVWHDGLIYKLEKINTPTHLIKMIASFLKNRKFIVNIRGEESTPRDIPAGLAQGSILSPLLYAIFTSDLKNPQNCELGLYADDTAILSAAKQSNTIIKRLEKALHRINDYFTKWRIKINADKTQAIIFKFNRARRRNPTIPLTFNGTTINLKREVTYLGVTLDDRLTFNEHIETCRTKALKCFSAIYPLLHSRSKLSQSNKLILYKTMIRPKITYAAPVWISTNETNINSLQRTQNKILKTILGVQRTFPTNLLHSTLEVEKIRTVLEDLKETFSTRCTSSNFDMIRRIANSSP